MKISLIGACMALLTLSTQPAAGAVRRCGPLVVSDIATAPSELAAKTQAMAQWRASALKLGVGFGSWRLAADKALKCFPKGGVTQCAAIGRPCIIEQKARPLPRPPGKSVGI